MGSVKLLLCLMSFLGQAATGATEISAITALTPEMRSWLDLHFPHGESPEARLHRLVGLIFNPDALNLQYDRQGTKTAGETFLSKGGNCLSFANMFVAMARHLGLDTRYSEAEDLPLWNRQGQVVLVNHHVNALVRIHDTIYKVDFYPLIGLRSSKVHAISDARALAHYYNNLGAETFVAGAQPRAIDYFKKALTLDSTFSFAWTNLGVAYAKVGDDPAAEQAYLAALDQDPGFETALHNLALLYRKAGRNREAGLFEQRAAQFRDANPYYHYHLGMDAIDRGDYKAAVRHLKRAIRRKRDEPHFFVALARVYEERGDLKRARTNRDKAQQIEARASIDQN